MNAKVICFASSKGGSGKTIITANISEFLTGIGKKCLIIDCDAATHGLTLLYLVEVSRKFNDGLKGLFDYNDNIDFDRNVHQGILSLDSGVDFIPATFKFEAKFDPEKKFNSNMLGRIVSQLREHYDYILLDAQAGSDKYSRLAMSKNISDEVVIVSEYDPLSAAGIERLKQVVGDDLDFTRTWVLLNKMLPEFVDKFSEFLSVTKYLPPIPWSADVVRAYANRKLALDTDKGNAYTLAIMRTVKVLFAGEIDEELALWVKNRSFALKEPLEKQYLDAEKELSLEIHLFNRNVAERTTANRNRIWMKRSLVALPTAVGLLVGLYYIYGFADAGNTSFRLMVVMVLASIPFYMARQGELNNLLSEEMESAEALKHKRRIVVLEERLKQLEALRSADFETIIRENSTGW